MSFPAYERQNQPPWQTSPKVMESKLTARERAKKDRIATMSKSNFFFPGPPLGILYRWFRAFIRLYGSSEDGNPLDHLLGGAPFSNQND
ncbi:hypothetical protein HPP92_006971 [Vanilla planifolia]|uniref:Uncharacterized protein n=1 Tax=Vanilla planifolia TaxID=51239 RepID=A0A835V970_VANPL|nr:hypothetical protein HPP92_007206 [Vanilla planifolia]KAG0490108.1 hypothetical protein HPP92_006971 [Vanilla planifolia]